MGHGEAVLIHSVPPTMMTSEQGRLSKIQPRSRTRFQQGISVEKARAISGLQLLGCWLATSTPTVIEALRLNTGYRHCPIPFRLLHPASHESRLTAPGPGTGEGLRLQEPEFSTFSPLDPSTTPCRKRVNPPEHTRMYCCDALVFRLRPRQCAFPAGDFSRESTHNLWPSVSRMPDGDQLADLRLKPCV